MFEIKDAEIVNTPSDTFAVSFTPGEKNANVNGFVHGGVIFLLADEAIGRYVTRMGKAGAASDADIHFYRPAIIGERLTATVYERKIGRRLGIFLIEVKNDAKKLVADVMITVTFSE